MMLAEQAYLEEIRARVCPKCVDGDGAGDCRISHGTECAVKRFLPQILEAVGSTYSTSMEPYELALRERVCRVCANQSPDGTCIVRNELECSLDRYFPLIVRVIEELDLKQRFSNAATGWR
ncbi:MAG: hypothetical protein AAB393_13050 [Bacteroidota bacterium]